MNTEFKALIDSYHAREEVPEFWKGSGEDLAYLEQFPSFDPHALVTDLEALANDIAAEGYVLEQKEAGWFIRIYPRPENRTTDNVYKPMRISAYKL